MSNEEGVPPPPPVYDPRHMLPVQEYIKGFFGNRDNRTYKFEDEIDVWGVGSKDASKTGVDHTITAEFIFNGVVDPSLKGQDQVQRQLLGDIPEERIEGDINPFGRDVSVAAISGMVAISGVSSYPVFTTFNTSWMHPSFKASIDQQDAVHVALGGESGAVMHLQPQMSKPADLSNYFINPGGYRYIDPGTSRTLANVTPGNLMNGIFMIPRAVCIEAYHEKAFPVYRPDQLDITELDAMQNRLLYWNFIPIDHVLAWPFNIPPDARAARQFNVLEYRFRARKSRGGEVHVLGLLVCNVTLANARDSFMARMYKHTYLSDLRNLDLQLVPSYRMRGKDAEQESLIKRDNGPQGGEARVRVTISYTLFESMTPEQRNALCPRMSSDFPVNTQPSIPVEFGPDTSINQSDRAQRMDESD